MSYSNPSWEQSRKLRERMRNGEELNIANGRLGMSKTDIEGILGGDSYDMIGVDSQHAPFNEEKLVEFCRNARELDMPVQFRIKNTRHTYLLGNLLDAIQAGHLCADGDEGLYPSLARFSDEVSVTLVGIVEIQVAMAIEEFHLTRGAPR